MLKDLKERLRSVRGPCDLDHWEYVTERVEYKWKITVRRAWNWAFKVQASSLGDIIEVVFPPGLLDADFIREDGPPRILHGMLARDIYVTRSGLKATVCVVEGSCLCRFGYRRYLASDRVRVALRNLMLLAMVRLLLRLGIGPVARVEDVLPF